MANIKSSKKRIRVLENKTARNKRVKARLKDILKDFEAAVGAGDKDTARETLSLAEKKLMQAASKGTLHSKTASRKVSRLTKGFIKEFGVEALAEGAKEKKSPGKTAKKAEAAEKIETAKAKEAEAPKEEAKEEDSKDEVKEESKDETKTEE